MVKAKEAKNLKESGEGYVRGFGGRKGKEQKLQLQSQKKLTLRYW